MKNNKFLGFNILITSISLIFIIIGLIGTFTYEAPNLNEIKTITGVIGEFKQRDGKWYDAIFGGSINSFFSVRLIDGSYYEATGIWSDNINRDLYEVINIGEEIKISYIDNGWSAPNDIVAIEYNGLDYLELNQVVKEFEKNDKIMKVVGPSIIGVTIIVSSIFYIINYKKNRLNKD